jgi:CRISPR-associated protein Cmr5
MRTRSQQDAQAIYLQVSRVPQNLGKQYGALCHRFPVLVLRSGLAQAIGFLRAKAKANNGLGESAHGLLLAHLAGHLGQNAEAQAFQERVNTASLDEYRRLTRAALAAAVWYKRYAESVLGVDATATEE